MSRPVKSKSERLETMEGALGNLASARVILDVVELRVNHATQYQPQLMFALDDITRIHKLIHQAQDTIVRSTHAAARLGVKCSR